MPDRMKIGIIGTDTSHSIAFTELLNDPNHRYHVKGGEIVVAYPGGSADFELSASRVKVFAEQLSSGFDIRIVDSPAQVAEASDAILLLSADGRVHREIFETIAPYGRPVFIDKPLSLSMKDAASIADLSRHLSLPVMSASALRYAEALTKQIGSHPGDDAVLAVDCYAPMFMEPTQTGYFWYGIHAVEMLYAILGSGCESVKATVSGDQETIVGVWRNGAIGTIRGSRSGGYPFAAAIHRERRSSFVYVPSEEKPFYASLLERVMRMFETGIPAVPMEVTLEIIRFIEAANESRKNGETIFLS